jgi:hypothetical protein
MPLDPITQDKMNEAIRMKLSNFKMRRNMHYENLVKPYAIEAFNFEREIIQQANYHNSLIDEVKLMSGKENWEDYAEEIKAKDLEISKLHEELEKKEMELGKKDEQIKLIEQSHKMKIEEEARLEKEKIEKNSSPPAKRNIRPIRELRHDPNIKLHVEVKRKIYEIIIFISYQMNFRTSII